MTLLDTQINFDPRPDFVSPPFYKPSFLTTLGGSALKTVLEPFAIAPLMEEHFFPNSTQHDEKMQAVMHTLRILQDETEGGSATAHYMGDLIGMAVSSLNWVTEGAGVMATRVATKKLLGVTEKTLLRREISATVKKHIVKFAAAGGIGATAALPQSLVESYNGEQRRIHWAGVAENAGLGAAIGLAIPAAPFAFRLLKRMKANGVSLTAEEEAFTEDYTKNSEATEEDKAVEDARKFQEQRQQELQQARLKLQQVQSKFHQYAQLTLEQAQQKLQKQAQAIIEKYKPELTLHNGKVPLYITDNEGTLTLQDAIAHALTAKTQKGVDTRLTKALIDSHLEKIVLDKDMVNGLDEFRRYQATLIRKRRAFAKTHQSTLFSRFHKLRPHSRKLTLSQASLYGKLKKGDISWFDMRQYLRDIPQALQEKLQDSSVALLSPYEELQKIISNLFTSKGHLEPEFFKSRYFGRLRDLASEWQLAKALLNHIDYIQKTLRHTQFLRLADYILNTADDMKPLRERLQSVIDSLQENSTVAQEAVADLNLEKPTPAQETTTVLNQEKSMPTEETVTDAYQEKSTGTIETIENEIPFKRTAENNEAYDLAKTAAEKARTLKKNHHELNELIQCVRGALRG